MKKFLLLLLCVLSQILSADKLEQELNVEKPYNNDTYTAESEDDIIWEIFFSGFYMKSSDGKGKNEQTIYIPPQEIKNFTVNPAVRKRFIVLSDKNINLITPNIPVIPDIRIINQLVDINVPALVPLPHINLNNITLLTIEDISISKEINVNLIGTDVTPKVFSSITVPTLNLRGNGNGYNQGSANANLYTNVDVFSSDTVLSASASQSALLQIIGTKGSNYPDVTGGDGSLTYTITTDIGTDSVGSRVIAMESHRGESGSPAGDPNEVIYLTTAADMNINAHDVKGVEIEQGYAGRPDIVYVNTGQIISSSSSYDVLGVDFIGSNGLLYFQNSGNMILNGDTSIGVQMAASGRVGIVNTDSGKIQVRGDNSYGIYLNSGNLSGSYTLTASNIDPSINFSNIFIQAGSIETYGNNNYGVVVKGNVTLAAGISLNDGSISVYGADSTGIYQDRNNNFQNTGQIQISGDNSNGIRVDQGTITNANSASIIIQGSDNSSGMTSTNLNALSKIINDGSIKIEQGSNNSIGMYGINGGISSNSLQNTGTIDLNLSGTGKNNVGVVNIASAFQNDGSITINDLSASGDNLGNNIAVYNDAGVVTLGSTSYVKVNSNGDNKGIYVKNGGVLNISGNIEIISLEDSGDYNYGIYMDSDSSNTLNLNNTALDLYGKSIGVYSGWDSIDFLAGNTINLVGSAGIGILYEVTNNTPVSAVSPVVENSGIINVSKGTGIYIYDTSNIGSKDVNNNSQINISGGGTGITVNSLTYNSTDLVSVINNGTIESTAGAAEENNIGIYSKMENLNIAGSGIIRINSSQKRNIGLYSSVGTVTFNGIMELGENSLGVYLDGSSTNTADTVLHIGQTGNEITQQSGVQSIGVFSSGEKGHVIIDSAGIKLLESNAQNEGSVGIYIKNSNLENNLGGKIQVGANGVAVYLNEAAAQRNIILGDMVTGSGGIGLYVKNSDSDAIDSFGSITTGTNSIAVAVISGMLNEDMLDESHFYLGDGSTGYFLRDGILTSQTSNKNITFGNNITGVLMTGSSGLQNIGKITVGDKTVAGVQPIVLGVSNPQNTLNLSTKLLGGDGTLGLYYTETLTSGTVNYNGSGSKVIPDIEIGKSGGAYSAVGATIKSILSGSILNLNDTYMKINGDNAVGLGANGGTINVNGGKLELTDTGTMFVIQNNGKINISSDTQLVVPDSDITIFTVMNSVFENNSGITLKVPSSSVGIYGKSSIIINNSEIASKVISGVPATESVGIYLEDFGKAVNNSVISLGNQGIGIFGTYSNIKNSQTGTIIIGDRGAGEYIAYGSVMENDGKIQIGEKSIGLYAKDVIGVAVYPGIEQNNNIINTGEIYSNGNSSIGIYSAGVDIIKRSDIQNTGIITLAGKSSVGIFGERTNVVNSGTITLGDGEDSPLGFNFSIGVMGRDSKVTINGGQITAGRDSIGAGIVSILEEAVLEITAGGISLGERSIYNYVKTLSSSGYTALLRDSSGGTYDLNLSRQVGFYSVEGNIYSNKTINVREGTGSKAVYVENGILRDIAVEGLTINIENGETGIVAKNNPLSQRYINFNNNINITGNSAQGLLHEEGKIVNSGKITINGTDSLGIVSIAVNSANPAELSNFAVIDVNGQSSVGIYGITAGAGVLTINNNALIAVADSGENLNSIGIYAKNNTNVNNSGDLKAGKNSVGIYGDHVSVVHTGGTVSVAETGVGFYAIGSQLQINGGVINLDNGYAIGVYATDSSSVINNGIINVGGSQTNSNDEILYGSFGLVGKDGSNVINNGNINMGVAALGMYSDNGIITNNGIIGNYGPALDIMDSRAGMYGVNNSDVINNNSINAGDIGIGIYGENSYISNYGRIITGDTYIYPDNPKINDFAVGIYGYNALGILNTQIIETGEKSIGIYSYKPIGSMENTGYITSGGTESVGVYIEYGGTTGIKQEFVNKGQVYLTGDSSVGVAGKGSVKIINDTGGVIRLTGNNSVGIYANKDVEVENRGLIEVRGKNGIGVLMKDGSTLLNTGIIDVDVSAGGRISVADDPSVVVPVNYLQDPDSYEIPSITNAGVIRVNEKFIVAGKAVIQIKVDPSTVTSPNPLPSGYAPEDSNAAFLISDSVKFTAPEFTLRNVKVTPDFSQGTNVSVYKLEDVFIPTTPGGGINYGTGDVVSKGIFWQAIPNVNSNGNLDIWMQRITYTELLGNTWLGEIATKLDSKYDGAQGKLLKFYDKLDMVEDISSLNVLMGGISGNIYANINQRVLDIDRVFQNSLDLLLSTGKSNDKTVKIDVITGKGSRNERTDGIVSYDYTTAGVLALKEKDMSLARRTGIFLGYLHTSFEFDDGNNSEEWVDSLEIGGYNKYTSENNWTIRNDLLGRMNIHNTDRNINWTSGEQSKFNGTYETYNIENNNIIGREIKINNNTTVMPYGGLKLMYVLSSGQTEKGNFEALEVERNDAFSIKPKIAVNIKSEIPVGKKKIWQVKGILDIGYEYELGNLNKQEKARIISVEENYHNLAKPSKEEGQLGTKALIGMEVDNKYGFFLTGEYFTGGDSREDYKFGIEMKASF